MKLSIVVYAVACCFVGCAAPTYLGAEQTAPHGQAPGATARLLSQREDGTREYALILAEGDEVATALVDFARRERIVAGRVLGLGAVRAAELAFFDVGKKAYRVNAFPEQAEVVSLLGDIGIDDSGKPMVHAHMLLSDETGRAFGGHLVKATVSPNLEVFVTAFPQALVRRPYPQFGAKFFDLSRSLPAAPAAPAP